MKLRSSFLAVLSILVSIGSAWAEPTISFNPPIVNLSVGEKVIVQVIVSDVPELGLAAFELKMQFDGNKAEVLNPNEAFRSTGIRAFIPLQGNFFCSAIRDIDPCPDPDWFLTSTGRTIGASSDNISTNEVFIVYATSAPPTPTDLPIGSGVIALIEVVGVANGATTISFPDGESFLTDASTVPVSYSITTIPLQVNVGEVIAENNPPILDLINDIGISEGQSVEITITANDPDDVDRLVFSTDNLPSFASLVDHTDHSATLTISPGFNDAGIYSPTVTVTDDGSPNLNSDQIFQITVINTNQPPTLAPIGNQVVAENGNLTINLSATDADGGTLSFTATGLPAFASLTDNGDGTASLTLTPSFADAGSYPISLTVTDNGSPNLSDSEDFTIEVGGTNQAPVLAPIGNQVVTENGNLTINLSASDADGDTLSFIATGLPSFASLTNNGDGTASLTLTPGFADAGSYPISLTVTDNGSPNLSDSEDFTIEVGGTNQAPVLAPIGNQVGTENGNLTINLSASDADGDTLNFIATGLPSFANLTDNGDGTASLTLTPGFADAGSYPISLTVTDNGSPNLSDSEDFTIEVGGTNQAPVLAPIGNQVVTENGTLTVNLSASDADGDTLSFIATGLPSFANLTDNGDGTASLTLTPSFADAGSYSISLTVTDNGSPNFSDSEDFTIEVGGTNQAPTADAGSDQNVITGNLVNLDGSNSSDPDTGDTLTLEWGFLAIPASSTLTDNDIAGRNSPTASFTPDVDGSFELALTVSDGFSSDTDTVIVRAETPPNIAPNAMAEAVASVQVGEFVTLDGTNSNDPDNGPSALTFKWMLLNTPTDSNFEETDIVDATLATAGFTPDAPGSYQFILEISDGLDSDTATVTIEASAGNVPPTADAGEDSLGRVDNPVFLDGSNSVDPDLSPDVLTYNWSFTSVPPGSTLVNADIVDATSALPNFTPDVTGDYLLRLDVSDGLDAHFDQVIVEVEPAPMTPGLAPMTPVNLTGRAKLLHVNIIWDIVENTTHYLVYRRLDSEIDFDEVGTTETNVYVDDLPTGTTSAEYYVHAINQQGMSEASETISIAPTTRVRRR